MAKIKKEINITAKAKYSEVERLNMRLKKTQSNLAGLKIGLLAAAPALLKLGDMARQAAASSFEFAAQLKDLAGAAGLGTTELQVLGRVAAQNGSSIEDMGKAILKLTKSTQEAANGNKQLSERFARLGIDIDKLKALAPERQMERIGLAVHAATDKQEALTEVMALVGQDAGPKLMESLKKLGTEGYDELARNAQKSGQILSEDAVASLDRAGQAFKDLWHLIKVGTAEAIGGVFTLKDALMSIEQIELSAAIAAHGEFSAQAARAAYQAASEAIEKGDHALGEQFAQNADKWAAQARQSIRQIEKASKGVRIPISVERARAKDAPFLSAQGWEGSKELLAQIDNLSARLQAFRDAQDEAAQIALDAAIQADLGRFFDTLDKQAARATEERLRQAAQAAAQIERFNFDKLAPSEQARVKAEAFFARIEELRQASAISQETYAAAALMREEQLASAAQLLHKETYAEQEKALVQVRSVLDAFARSQQSQSEQLRSQAQDFHAQYQALAAENILSTEELARAQELYNQKLREADELLKSEQKAQALAALSERTKELAADFAALDEKLESELSTTLTEFATTGQADMKELGQSIINDVIKAMLKALVIKPLLSGLGGLFGGLGGGGGGGIFGSLGKGLLGGLGGAAIPARASGGPVTGRQPYLVGERGPELFIPPRSGTIIDANKTAAALGGDTATGGDRGPQNIYQIDARGADAGAVQRLEHALLKLAGPGVVEKRARAAEGEYRRRG